jgi:ribonuclease P protein component
MRLLRLQGRKICDSVLRKGRVWKGKHMTIRSLAGAPRHPAATVRSNALYVGTVASTKLDKSAVKRNRMRRRCREALRLLLKETDAQMPAIQLLLAPRSSSLWAPFPELQADLRAFLRLPLHGTADAKKAQ